MSLFNPNVHSLEDCRRTFALIAQTSNNSPVNGPLVSTIGKIPAWSDTHRTLADGYTVTTTLADPGVDTKLATEKAIRSAITAAVHTRLHAIDSTLDHSSTITQNGIMKANANGLPALSSLTDNGTTLTTSDTSFTPASNDGTTLGTASLKFSDLFLAHGGVINWDNGDMTLTNSDYNELTFAGGDVIFSLGASDKVTIDGYTTPHYGSGGSLFVMTKSDEADVDGIYSSMSNPSANGRQLRGVYSRITDGTIKTANNLLYMGVDGSILKYGADNNPDTTTIIGVGADVMDLGSVGVVGNRNVYGMYSTVIESGALATVYGLYAYVSGGTTKWAGYFENGDVKIDGGSLVVDGTVDGVDVSSVPARAIVAQNNSMLWSFLLAA